MGETIPTFRIQFRDPNSANILLKDPLSEVTRSERRTLLATSAVGLVIVKAGLIPTKISALGIEFTQTNQKYLLLAIAAIIIYFLIAFLLYAGSDFIASRISYLGAIKQRFLKTIEASDLVESDEDYYPDEDFTKQVEYLSTERDISEEEARQELLQRINIMRRFGQTKSWLRLTPLMSFSRAMFEFVVPIVVSIYAIIALLIANS
jgi:hypothetical protein